MAFRPRILVPWRSMSCILSVLGFFFTCEHHCNIKCWEIMFNKCAQIRRGFRNFWLTATHNVLTKHFLEASRETGNANALFMSLRKHQDQIHPLHSKPQVMHLNKTS